MRIRACALLLALLLALPAAAQPARPAQPTETDEDRKPSLRTGGSCLLINGVFLTATGRTVKGSMLVKNGLIVALGEKVPPPDGVRVIDLEGQHVIPGVIDAHSHIAIGGGVNEMRDTITAEVRIEDAIRHTDVSIYRALAGGTTAAHLMHGSANPIGGQCVVVKLRYGSSAKKMVFRQAPRTIKFALGENVVRGGDFPDTRMGVEATIRRALSAARDYLAAKKAYERKRDAGLPAYPPRKDLRLETLAGILEGKVHIHSHSYRADEILMLLRVTREFGVRVKTLHHALEAYKIAPEIARHGAGVSTFSDWWGYKVEAYDATPYNAAYLVRAGVLVSIKSDSPDLIRRMPLEAAKSIRYGGITENEALQLVTLNPAKQLQVDKWVGSLEVGKHADLAVFSGHPFDTASRCTLTFIDGEVVFERRAAAEVAPLKLPERRERLATPARADTYAIVGAMVHPIVGEPIPDGVVVVTRGRISAVGPEGTPVPEGASRIDGRGLHCYPALINAWSRVGLTEIGSLAETKDDRERGAFKPDLTAASAVNPESAHIPVTRAGGVGLCVTAPSGGTICGQGALIQLAGWTVRELTLDARIGLVVAFPFAPAKKKNPKLEALNKFLSHARAYATLKAAHEKQPVAGFRRNLLYEPMLPYLAGERPVLVAADAAASIRQAVAWAAKEQLRIVLVGARDAGKVAPLLAKKKIPVVFGRMTSRPAKPFDPYDFQFSTPAKLAKLGVPFALATDGASDARNLGMYAGMARAYGLSDEQAMQAITIAPARLLGIDKLAGSIEVGKRGDLILTTGSPLQIVTQVVGMLIGGKPVSLQTRHTRLYEKYLARLRAK